MGALKRVRDALMGRSRRDDDVERELREHVDLEIEELVAEGKTPEEARALALRTVGNVTIAREQVHDLSPWAWWEQLWQDVRYGLRSFRRTPAFALTAVLTLALGVGANSAIFSVIDALALRPLPVSRPETLVVVRDEENGNFSYPDYRDLRDRSRTVADLIASSNLLKAPVDAGAGGETAAAKIVSSNYFMTLGVAPAAGRLLGPVDEQTAVAVISHGYWTRRFGRSAGAVGRRIRLLGVPLTVVGVAPAGFFGETPGEAPDLWVSMALQRKAMLDERGFSWLYLMGRLEPGATLPQAQAEMAARFAEAAEGRAADAARITVASGAQGGSRWRDRMSAPLSVVMALVMLVLLIACTNLATLMLTRGTVRQPEIAMRLAIGASRSRLVRQLVTEALLLSIGGGALGVLVAAWGARVLVRMASAAGTGPELSLPLAVDARLLLFTAATSALAGLLFGVGPAVREIRNAGRVAPGPSRGVVASERAWGLRGVLIAAQVALSLVLVACSVMFIRTVRNLELQDLGFRADGLLRVEIESERGYDPPAAGVSALLERAAAIPGVESATGVTGGTLASIGGVTGLRVDGYAARDDQDRRARADWVGPSYFRVAGIPLAAGRDFTPADDARAALVAVVNQTAARHYFGADARAVGRRLTWNDRHYEIVGVAANAKYADLRERTPRMVYFPLLQMPSALNAIGLNAVELRAPGADLASLTAAMRAVVRDVDPRLTVGEALTLSQQVDRKLGREHLLADLSGFFGALTLLLVSIGIYGTVAYSAGRRTRELGVRVALGARRRGVVWLMLRDVAVVVAAGVALGTAGALGAGRLVRALLFGLEPADPITLAGGAGLLLAVALGAGLLPALRASRLDPASVLRE